VAQFFGPSVAHFSKNHPFGLPFCYVGSVADHLPDVSGCHIRVSFSTRNKLNSAAKQLGLTHDELVSRLCDHALARTDHGYLGELRDLSVRAHALDLRLLAIAGTLQTLARTLERSNYEQSISLEELLAETLRTMQNPSHISPRHDHH
jgi:hypothetical protein